MLRTSVNLLTKRNTLTTSSSLLKGSTVALVSNNTTRSYSTYTNSNESKPINVISFQSYQLKNTTSLFNTYNTNGLKTQQRSYSTLPPHIKVGMPALSPSMETGNIAKWRKNEGDKINVGDVIAEIETDKATMDFESQDSGYLAKILVSDGGKNIPINQLIAIIVSKKEDVGKFKDFSESAAPAAAAAAPTPAAAPAPAAAAPAPKAASPASNYPKHTVIGMPALSPSMETGGIAKWRKNEGEKINVGDVIAEVETDKATMDFESQDAGYLAKILVKGGSGIEINSPVAIMVSKKEDVDKFKDYTLESAKGGSAPAASAEPAPQQSSQPVQQQQTVSNSGNRIFSSPAARFVAKEKGYDIQQITGTGPNNRIVKADVLNFTPQQQQAQPQVQKQQERPQQQKQATIEVGGTFTDIPHSNIRRVTASRLSESKQTIPHYYLTMECRVDQLLSIRTTLNNQANGKFKLSVNDFIIKAASAALHDVPTVNSTWMSDVVRRFHNVDINVAVNTEQGLFTPLIRDADKKGLATIANQVKDLAEKAKIGKLQPQDFQSGTFTISNLGMFGIKNFSAVINPPQAAILAVGTTEKRIASVDEKGQVQTETVMSVTLSCDHRVIDGAVGAEWLQKFKDYIENPLKLLL